MKKIVITTLSFLLLIYTNVCKANSDLNNYSFYTEYSPPYNYTKDDMLLGYSADILKNIIDDLKLDKSLYGVKVLDWKDAIEITTNTNKTVLFSVVRHESREKYFKWVGPIHISQIGLIGLEKSQIEIKSNDDIKKYKIGGIKDDIGISILLEKGCSKENIFTTTDFYVLLKKLHEKEIDLIAYDIDVTAWRSKTFNTYGNNHKVYNVMESKEYYFAFNKNTPDDIIDDFQASLNKVKSKIINNITFEKELDKKYFTNRYE